MNIRGLRRIRRFFHRGYEGAVQAALVGLPDPVLVLEYLENGDVGRLYDRAVQQDILLPNRVLWSFFLCCRLPRSSIYLYLPCLFFSFSCSFFQLRNRRQDFLCGGCAFQIGRRDE